MPEIFVGCWGFKCTSVVLTNCLNRRLQLVIYLFSVHLALQPCGRAVICYWHAEIYYLLCCIWRCWSTKRFYLLSIKRSL